jgi:hypothetical protein
LQTERHVGSGHAILEGGEIILINPARIRRDAIETSASREDAAVESRAAPLKYREVILIDVAVAVGIREGNRSEATLGVTGSAGRVRTANRC